VSPATWFGAWLAALALAVSLGFELVYVRDHLAGGDWYRMNTVFKFGLQVWVLLGMAAAAVLPGFVRALRRAGLLASALGTGVLTALVVLALTFPLAGIPSRTAYRFRESPVPTLDGLAFLDRAIYYVYPQYLGLPEGSFEPVPIALRHDADAIRWLNSTIEGTPVVIQSSAEFYRLYGVRVAANTGLPTVVSPLHEAEQRTAADVYARDRDVQLFYRTNDPGEALRVIAKYHIGYIYIGPIERLVYGTAGMAKFEELAQPQGPLSLAYQNDGVSIYQVKPVAYTLAEPAGPVSAAPAGEEASLGALEQQVAAAPEDLGAAWQLAQRYADRGRFDDAARVIEPHAIARPGDAGVQHFYGDLLNLAGRADEAEQAYRRAVNANPSASNYTKLGAALLQWGRLDDAEQALALAIQADPDQPTAYFFLGQAAEERGQRSRAADYFQQFLDRAEPSDPLRSDAEAALQRLTAR
jgi:tetratricopeptide (TPR) repeat protein